MTTEPKPYTPSTEEVREAFSEMSGWDMSADESDAAFKRWLSALLREERAKALEDAADEVRAVFADDDRQRPLRPDAETPTDFVNDAQWAELIVRNRAESIRNEGITDERP